MSELLILGYCSEKNSGSNLMRKLKNPYPMCMNSGDILDEIIKGTVNFLETLPEGLVHGTDHS